MLMKPASYPGGGAASWCIQRTLMVIQLSLLLLCSCYPLIRLTIKFTSTMQHCSSPPYLTETQLPLLSLSFLRSLKLSESLLSSPLVAPVLYSLPVSLNLATCIDSPTPLPSPFTLHTLSLCTTHSLTNTHTHALRLLFTHSAVCLPPALPASRLYLSSDCFLSSVCLCFYLFLSLSLSSSLRPSSSGLQDV